MKKNNGDQKPGETVEDSAPKMPITDTKAGQAHTQADKDIASDPENAHSPNDDLDEGELSRLGEDTKDII